MNAHDELSRRLHDLPAGETSVPLDRDLAYRLLAEHARTRRGLQIAPPCTDPMEGRPGWNNAAHPALQVRPDGSVET